jgi:hypothetical protein
LWQELASFLNKKRSPKQHGQGNFFWKNSAKIPHSKEESYEWIWGGF